MPVVHQFAYGAVNPIVAFRLALIGSMFGLTCTARARPAETPGRRARWLLLAALAIGGAVWLMHFMAILGFDVPATDVRFDAPLTIASFLIAIVVVAGGLFLVGWGRATFLKVFFGGVLTGSGIAAMHFIGMAAMRMGGHLTYDARLVGASVLIAIAAAMVALWFTVAVRGWKAITVASAIMAAAVCSMHYTGMSALHVHLNAVQAPDSVTGLSPLSLIVPIIVLGAAIAMGLIFAAMSMMTDEEFNARPAARAAVPVSPAVSTTGPKPVSLREFDARHKNAALRSHRG
jgi:NO-binding membrane sensor protein with MHYT domain